MRLNINLYVEYLRTNYFSRILSWLIRQLNFTQNDLHVRNFRPKKNQISISRKICYVRLGFQILYEVEQFMSLFSK